MTDQLTLGFGDATQAGLIRSDAGALLCRGGETTAGPTIRVEATGAGWRASGEHGLDLAFEPLGEPASFADGTREWLCRARGETSAPPSTASATRWSPGRRCGPGSASAWPGRSRPGSMTSWRSRSGRAGRPGPRTTRPRSSRGSSCRGAPPLPHPIADPRLSTAYGGDGRQRRAGLELWETEEADYALRLAGEAIGEGTLELPGGARLEAAFFAWRHDGELGAGRYDIIRPRVARLADSSASGGVWTRLAPPGVRQRATSTPADTGRRQITPSHSPATQAISETHPSPPRSGRPAR